MRNARDEVGKRGRKQSEIGEGKEGEGKRGRGEGNSGKEERQRVVGNREGEVSENREQTMSSSASLHS